jgi:hypothetical protein
MAAVKCTCSGRGAGEDAPNFHVVTQQSPQNREAMDPGWNDDESRLEIVLLDSQLLD